MKALILDDDPATLSGLADLLRLDGHEVVAAGTVTVALDSMTVTGPPDIAFVDVYLASGSVAWFLKSVKSHPSFRDVPVVLMSGAGADDPAVREAMALGASGYLKKPFDPSALLEYLKPKGKAGAG